MRPELTYYGPVWIIAGEHKGKLGFVDDYDDEDESGEVLGIVYVEGEVPSKGEYEAIPVSQLDQPAESEIGALEERIWMNARRR